MSATLLEARGLVRRYRRRGHGLGGSSVLAVDHVDLEVNRGEVVAIVGESGSGKSTLVRLLLSLERPDAGQVRFDGVVLTAATERSIRPLRKRFQAVFQDAADSIDPRLDVEAIVTEPLAAHRLGGRDARRRRALEVLAAVGLPAETLGRRPTAFSGGERQRIAIARALATAPELVVFDEPVSALDVTIQGRILALLASLQRELGLTMVLVTHDLEVARRVADRLAVMLAGRIVEEGPSVRVLETPGHPYTEALRAAIPTPGGARLGPDRQPASGLEPSPSGCAFLSRCPNATTSCRSRPPLRDLCAGVRAACHHPLIRSKG